MLKGFEEFQKVGKDGFDAAVKSFGEMNKGFQAIAAEVTDYSKKAFEDGTRAFEQLIGAKSVEQAVEIQSTYAKKAPKSPSLARCMPGSRATLTSRSRLPSRRGSSSAFPTPPGPFERPGVSARVFFFAVFLSAIGTKVWSGTGPI
jgi:hypothetical protein